MKKLVWLLLLTCPAILVAQKQQQPEQTILTKAEQTARLLKKNKQDLAIFLAWSAPADQDDGEAWVLNNLIDLETRMKFVTKFVQSQEMAKYQNTQGNRVLPKDFDGDHGPNLGIIGKMHHNCTLFSESLDNENIARAHGCVREFRLLIQMLE